MRCLVTGGAGFIGSHLSERLLASGHEVLAIDDLSTGSMENILSFRSNINYEFHGDSVFNRRLMAELVDLVDIVFHLAAAVGVRRIVEHPVQTIETNVGGTEVSLPPRSGAGSSSPRPPRFTESRTSFRSLKPTISYWAAPITIAGLMLARRRSTSFWRWLIIASTSCR